MTTHTTTSRPTASTGSPTVAEARWSRILRVLAPGMATVGMFMGAPMSRTVWSYLLTERIGTQRPPGEAGPNPRSPR